MPKVEINLDEDPANQKIFIAFKKVSMHQFWKKAKGSIKVSGDADDKKDANQLIKQFNLGLGKVLDKFDNCFPDPAQMKKYSGELEKIFRNYEKKVDESEIGGNFKRSLDIAIELLEKEMNRRLAWAKKYIK
ncbi:MAG TPA: hypothetical protein VHX65_17710 [Pirellulales bacterium]|nr:hypothetical protein [Pirellulales bacterium]